MRSQRLMYTESLPPATPAGSSPVAPEVCKELCEVPSTWANSQGSPVLRASTSPSQSSGRARRLHVAGASRLQRELHTLVGHLLLQRRNLHVQSLGRLGGLSRVCDLALELRDAGVLCPERILVVSAAALGAYCGARRLLLARLALRLPRALRLALLPSDCLTLCLRAILPTVHLDRLSYQAVSQQPASFDTAIVWCGHKMHESQFVDAGGKVSELALESEGREGKFD